jgi:Mg/Co/Ni transporter MgtE
MREHGIRRLPVIDRDGRVMGVLTFDDAVELMSEELVKLTKLVARQPQREASRRPVEAR